MATCRHVFPNREKIAQRIRSILGKDGSEFKYDKKKWFAERKVALQESADVMNNPLRAGAWGLDLIFDLLEYVRTTKIMEDLLFAPFDKQSHRRLNLTSAVDSRKTTEGFYNLQTTKLVKALDSLGDLMKRVEPLAKYADLLLEILKDFDFAPKRTRAPAARLRFLLELVVHSWLVMLAPAEAKKPYDSSRIGAQLKVLVANGLDEERRDALEHISWCTHRAFHCVELEVGFPRVSEEAMRSAAQHATLCLTSACPFSPG